MNYFKLISIIYLKDGRAVTKDCKEVILSGDAVEAAILYSNRGADELLVFDLSTGDKEHDLNINVAKKIADKIDIPMLLTGNIKRLEDVKKYIYAGAKMTVLDLGKETDRDVFPEAVKRFGNDRIGIFGTDRPTDRNVSVLAYDCVSTKEDILELFRKEWIYGLASSNFTIEQDLMSLKYRLKEIGVNTLIYESKKKFSDFKTNSDGMIPVVVQDYKTNEVLMLAYMNEEAYDTTIRTGRMTYFSRSRNELWEKGFTLGHFQYVKELIMDCDMDTMLAKVFQVGVPCHTGAKTCFYNRLLKKEYDNSNPLKVFEDVYNVILDRQQNPKEGSYTNYLFEKGIDKILKKVGEEASEVIIASKNSDKEEIKYEISDLLYHLMVLMVEKDISWNDITKELARR